MSDISVRHAQGEYRIRFGDAAEVASLLDGRDGKQVLVIADRSVQVEHGQRLSASLPAGTGLLQVDAGDEAKNLTSLQAIWDACADHGLRRDGLLIALGGGVVGDMTGFAAATWMRGIDYLQVPTTLLAQVDSSVGGKTAINHRAGKNLVGAFHPPVGVLIDFAFLDTLPAREFSAGMAEIIKAAMLAGDAELDELEALAPAIMAGDRPALRQAVRMAIDLKARIVAADEREAGQRAFLNLGHTFGHAIERELGYGRLLHGEAVGLGLLAACSCAARVCGLRPELGHRLEGLLQACQLPTRLPHGAATTAALLDAMSLDKKALASGLRLVLLEAPGKPLLAEGVSADAIRAAWDTLRADA